MTSLRVTMRPLATRHFSKILITWSVNGVIIGSDEITRTSDRKRSYVYDVTNLLPDTSYVIKAHTVGEYEQGRIGVVREVIRKTGW